MPQRIRHNFEQHDNADFPLTREGLGRFRVNGIPASRRLRCDIQSSTAVSKDFGTIESAGAVRRLVPAKRGLILVTGKTDSGKSATLAAMMDVVNQTSRGHVITIEDPIEFVHQRKKSLISKREIGEHTASFASALRSALREDPDAILVGELRHLETISLAVTGAETGVLVMSTLHTNSAAGAVNRIINMFPTQKRAHVRAMLSTSLRGVNFAANHEAGRRPWSSIGAENIDQHASGRQCHPRS